MKLLILGGTRFFGIHLVHELLNKGYDVTITTHGRATDYFGDRLNRLIVERTSPESLHSQLSNSYYDVTCDNLAYCSNDVKYLLDNARFGRYVMTSSASVYAEKLNTVEEDFDPLTYLLKWCNCSDYSFDEIKRQSECALFQVYSGCNAVAVRYPYVIGEDDYTKCLYFYVVHIVKQIPMHIDNLDEPLGFIRSTEARAFHARLVDQAFTGPINGSSEWSISLREIPNFVERRTNTTAAISVDDESAPYNGGNAFSLRTILAVSLGYHFSSLRNWIFQLLDTYIEQAQAV